MDYIVKQDDISVIVEETKTKVKQDNINQYITLRKKKRMTQEDIANTTGIARANIARVESGRNVPTIEILTKLAIALDMDLEIKFVERGDK